MIDEIITHPGGAHKDEFLACAVLLAEHDVPVSRQDPTEEDLLNPSTAVIDIGHRHQPDLHNFDHHQFARDAKPTCSLSLVLDHYGIYEDALSFCPWLEVAEWFDCRGPKDTSEWLGVERETVGKLNSPLDITILQAFAKSAQHLPGEPIWEMMKMIGGELLQYIRNLRSRIEEVAKVAEVWEINGGKDSFKVMFVPREQNQIEEVSGAMGWHIKELGMEEEVVAIVYPDSRGEGYGMKRFNDRPEMDFSKIANEERVRFAHARGFIAKVEPVEIDELKQLLLKAYSAIN
jgi:hypothetical protein